MQSTGGSHPATVSQSPDDDHVNDELRPLLESSKAPAPYDAVVVIDEETAPSSKTEEPAGSDWKWWITYAVLTIAGIVGLSLFIKAFIDSGDVDVSKSLSLAGVYSNLMRGFVIVRLELVAQRCSRRRT